MGSEHDGRTPLTEAVKAVIVSSVREGAPVEPACEAAGISVSTYYNWMRWGKGGKEPYASFLQDVTRARAEAELELLSTAKAGDDKGESNGPARCAQWILERTRGNRYAARVNVKVEEELETLLDVVERICSSKDCGCQQAILEALAARDRGEALSDTEGEPSEQVH